MILLHIVLVVCHPVLYRQNFKDYTLSPSVSVRVGMLKRDLAGGIL